MGGMTVKTCDRCGMVANKPYGESPLVVHSIKDTTSGAGSWDLCDVCLENFNELFMKGRTS